MSKAIEMARAVLAHKTSSYVTAAQVLAQRVLDDAERIERLTAEIEQLREELSGAEQG